MTKKRDCATAFRVRLGQQSGEGTQPITPVHRPAQTGGG